jgi:hypothetical protein
MAYEVWLSWNNQAEGFQLPINPSSLEVSNGSKGSTYDIEKLGEINVIKNPALTSYSFSGLLPVHSYPFATVPRAGMLAPITANGITHNPYVYYINKWMESKRPVRFVFIGDNYRINEAVSIESFDWQDVAGSGGDITYSIELKKYRFYAAQKVTVGQTPSGAASITKSTPERANDKQPPKTHTLRAGESLWTVAQLVLGNGNRWTEIKQLNGLTDAQLKTLPVGKALKLP